MSFTWQTGSAAAGAGTGTAPRGASVAARRGARALDRIRTRGARAPRPELLGLIVLAGVLNTWALTRNGWANEYYSAAVRSMSSSWHDFLFASLDPAGVMSVDKPPLALWVQALSVRVFGYHQLSVLLPQALMGVASVLLVYDLVRRRFGRIGGTIAGIALAVTPMTVAVSRHNNPDALLVLCSVAALWCAVRALEGGRTRWLVLAGACVGLGFETKMGVALTVVPGIALAWLWVSPAGRGRLHALRQLLAAGAVMALIGGAWPALVELTPASQRPWVSGTSDNSVLSLALEYNGAGRVDGQAGGPPGGGGGPFGSTPGPLRLLNAALGGQAGWLLGFAVLTAFAALVACRLRRADTRTGWLLAVGGAFLVTAALFSAASGIFHPYYVSLLAPFTAALVGAGAAQLISGRLKARVLGPLAIAAGIACELAVRSNYPGQLTWLPPVLVAFGALTALALAAPRARRLRTPAVILGVGALLLAPTAWAFETLGYAASGTFPAGGPASAAADAPGGGFAGMRAFMRSGGGFPRAAGPARENGPPAGPPGEGAPPLGGGLAPGGPGGAGGPPAQGAGGAMPGGLAGAGPFGGGASLRTVLAYIKAHGGGTLAVASQSSASTAIVSNGAQVAGIGGFSGRESSVSIVWLAQEVRAGRIRWVQTGEGSAGSGTRSGMRLPGDTRAGSSSAMSAVARSCRALTIPGSTTTTRLYDCSGRAAALLAGARTAAS